MGLVQAHEDRQGESHKDSHLACHGKAKSFAQLRIPFLAAVTAVALAGLIRLQAARQVADLLRSSTVVDRALAWAAWNGGPKPVPRWGRQK